jgi:hypothetical protein
VTEAPTTDIAELFARDPLQLSEQDLNAIIGRLREQRAQFNLGNAMAGSMKPKTAKAKITQDLASKLDLGNLFGDL